MLKLMLIAAMVATAAQASAQELRFVTCPVYRDADAGRKSGCWLATDNATGIRYDVTTSPTKPDWNFAVLVEGAPSAAQGDRLCGSPTLDPVRVSVLYDIPCTRHMLPAEGFPGRRFTLPKRNVRPFYEARTPAARPWKQREFVIPFDQNRDFFVYQLSDYLMDQAILYALDVGRAKIDITGYADTRTSKVSGYTLSEPLSLAKDRAIRAGKWLSMRGVDVSRMNIRWEAAKRDDDNEAFDGLKGPSRRMVRIVITPLDSGDTPKPLPVNGQGRSSSRP